MRVAVTGVGLVCSLGTSPQGVLAALERGDRGLRPATDDERRLGVEQVGEVVDFVPGRCFGEAGFKRLMSREAQLATAAAGLALASAGLSPGTTCPREAVDCYAATGASGLDFRHILRMIDASAGDDGRFDEQRFSTLGLQRIHPLLSFKILPNMPPCFLSILHGLRGDNLIFNPWEGQGGQALTEGFHRAAERTTGAVLAGASDVKTHTQAFVFLNQVGVSTDPPGEAAAYLVLEPAEAVAKRRGQVRAWLESAATASDPAAGWGYTRDPGLLENLFGAALQRAGGTPDRVVVSCTGRSAVDEAELTALERVLPAGLSRLAPKAGIGDTFAAAGAVALSLAVAWVERDGGRVLVDCLGNGRERACFVVAGPQETP